MLPVPLLKEDVFGSDGVGPAVDTVSHSGKLLVLSLAITRIIEQESLEISVWGSSDGVEWGVAPLVCFPRKFYCGTYSKLLNLSTYAHVRFLSVRWKINQLGRPGQSPMVSFFVEVQESGSRLQSAVA